MEAPLETPPGKIHAAMVAVMRSVGAIAKDKKNVQQGFAYRGIDDVYGELHQHLAEAGIYCRPIVLKREQTERTTKSGGVMYAVTMHMQYHLTAEDGSSVFLETIGEGMDHGDKATNKAMAIAHKYALLQAFLVPTEEMTDPDATTPEETVPSADVRQPAPKPAKPAPAPKPAPSKAAAPAVGKQVWNDVCILEGDQKDGISSKGPWTLWLFKLSNGMEVKTFSKTVAQSALTMVDDTAQNPVDIEVVPGRKEGTWELVSVTPAADDVPH